MGGYGMLFRGGDLGAVPALRRRLGEERLAAGEVDFAELVVGRGLQAEAELCGGLGEVAVT